MSRKIIVGILLFVIIFTIPIWYNLITKGKKPEISLDTPEIRALEKKSV